MLVLDHAPQYPLGIRVAEPGQPLNLSTSCRTSCIVTDAGDRVAYALALGPILVIARRAPTAVRVSDCDSASDSDEARAPTEPVAVAPASS
jgi:hypothetical protein